MKNILKDHILLHKCTHSGNYINVITLVIFGGSVFGGLTDGWQPKKGSSWSWHPNSLRWFAVSLHHFLPPASGRHFCSVWCTVTNFQWFISLFVCLCVYAFYLMVEIFYVYFNILLFFHHLGIITWKEKQNTNILDK